MQIRTCLAIGSWALLAVAMAQQQMIRPGRSTPPLTKEQRIDKMHTGFQAALEDLSMTKLRSVIGKDSQGRTVTYKVAPVFGLRRTPTIPILHGGVVRDSDVPVMFGGDPWIIEFYAVSNKGKPLMQHSMQFHPDFGSFAGLRSQDLSKDVVAFADKALPSFGKQNSYLGKVQGLYAQARPLRLTKMECLPCHKESHVGDPMAILVYVARKPDNSRRFPGTN